MSKFGLMKFGVPFSQVEDIENQFGFMGFGLPFSQDIQDSINFSLDINANIKANANILASGNFNLNVLTSNNIQSNIIDKCMFDLNLAANVKPSLNVHQKFNSDLQINVSGYQLTLVVVDSAFFYFIITDKPNVTPLYRRFDFMKFGAGKPSNDLEDCASFALEINENAKTSLNINQKFSSEVQIFKYIFPSLNIYQQHFNYNLQFLKYVFPSLNIEQKFSINVQFLKYIFSSLNIYQKSNTDLQFLKYIFPSLNIYNSEPLNYNLEILKYIFPSLDIYHSKPLIYNLEFLKYIILTILETQIVNLNIKLNPKDQLILNSDIFDFTINGENALHLHSGDWINLNRILEDFIIEASGGQKLDGQIIYNERFF